jgi:hypothetical protein
MSGILTRKGYSILKQSLNVKETEKIINELTVTPKTNPNFVGKVTPFKIYRESPTRWYFPRAWARERLGPEISSVVPDGTALSDTSKVFVGTPYDYQEIIIRKFIDSGKNGLICVPCGKGKTFMALSIAARIGRRFLIVVDKEFLADQWRGEIKQYLPNIRVGILQSTKKEVDPTLYDCTICMIQTLCLHDLAEDTFDEYGFTIFDECHHLGAQYFSKTLLKVQTKYMLGLSATPDREDGLTRVFEAFLGKPVYQEKTREPDPTVTVKGVMLDIKDAEYQEIPCNWKGEPVMARLLSKIAECAPRNREIIRWILWLSETPGRRILVLSERISHLEALEAVIKTHGITVGYYIGNMKTEVREGDARDAQVLFASYQMASEAMNIKTLNSVVFATPRKRIEQSSGRILRVKKEDRTVDPIIIDIIDTHTMYMSQWQKRLTYYRKCSYQIEQVKMGEINGTALAARARRRTLEDLCLIDD